MTNRVSRPDSILKKEDSWPEDKGGNYSYVSENDELHKNEKIAEPVIEYSVKEADVKSKEKKKKKKRVSKTQGGKFRKRSNRPRARRTKKSSSRKKHLKFSIYQSPELPEDHVSIPAPKSPVSKRHSLTSPKTPTRRRPRRIPASSRINYRTKLHNQKSAEKRARLDNLRTRKRVVRTPKQKKETIQSVKGDLIHLIRKHRNQLGFLPVDRLKKYYKYYKRVEWNTRTNGELGEFLDRADEFSYHREMKVVQLSLGVSDQFKEINIKNLALGKTNRDDSEQEGGFEEILDQIEVKVFNQSPKRETGLKVEEDELVKEIQNTLIGNPKKKKIEKGINVNLTKEFEKEKPKKKLIPKKNMCEKGTQTKVKFIKLHGLSVYCKESEVKDAEKQLSVDGEVEKKVETVTPLKPTLQNTASKEIEKKLPTLPKHEYEKEEIEATFKGFFVTQSNISFTQSELLVVTGHEVVRVFYDEIITVQRVNTSDRAIFELYLEKGIKTIAVPKTDVDVFQKLLLNSIEEVEYDGDEEGEFDDDYSGESEGEWEYYTDDEEESEDGKQGIKTSQKKDGERHRLPDKGKIESEEEGEWEYYTDEEEEEETTKPMTKTTKKEVANPVQNIPTQEVRSDGEHSSEFETVTESSGDEND